ncbi:MAG: NnrU family protein [Burkholderiaceae bacterium]|nr:NnrU family protein [Burkholderiaceae bacterium]
MGMLILGLVLFLGVHSVRIFANDWRTQVIAQRGEGAWKGLYSLLSILGFGLIVWGYGLARQQPVVLWLPPVAMRHIAALLTLFAFILLTAAYVPRNGIKAWLHHPMVLGVKVWAFAHLLANGNLADVVLFGAFLVWAALSFRAARGRDRVAGTVYPSGSLAATAITVVVGTVAWVVFTLWLHLMLIGVRPFGG